GVVNREIARKEQAASLIPSTGTAPSYVPAASVPIVDASTGGPGDYATEGLRDRYTSLLKREDALQEFQPSTAGPATPFFQMVDEPNIPESSAGPIRSKLMMIALGLSLVIGVLSVAAVEARKMSMICDERDVSYFLGVPVIALIPETLTIPERGRVRQQL